MSFVEWDQDEYGIGVDRVDEQHERLFELLNEFYEAMQSGEGKELVGETLEELEDYTYYHFEDEEEYMGECGFADDCEGCFFAQQDAHRAFEDEVSELREKYEAGEATVHMETLRFLRTWVSTHVGEMDQQIGAYHAGESDLDPVDMDVSP